MIRVVRHQKENIDALLTRFNKAVRFSNILKEAKGKEVYYKPSVQKRRARAENKRLKHKYDYSD